MCGKVARVLRVKETRTNALVFSLIRKIFPSMKIFVAAHFIGAKMLFERILLFDSMCYVLHLVTHLVAIPAILWVLLCCIHVLHNLFLLHVHGACFHLFVCVACIALPSFFCEYLSTSFSVHLGC